MSDHDDRQARYDALVAVRAEQAALGCCDCGKREGYTSVRQGIICRSCFTKRAGDRTNPHYGDTESG